MRKITKLANYAAPAGAARKLAALRAAWPENEFEVLPSPSAAYAFRYLIRATNRNGFAGWVAAGKVPVKVPA
jgi:hypothetical protein